MIILEEASRLDQAVFQEVVVPLLGVRDTALIGISTPLDENNFYSELVQSKKPDGNLLFNVVTIRLLCDECEKTGQMHCPHNADVRTHARAHAHTHARAKLALFFYMQRLVCLPLGSSKRWARVRVPPLGTPMEELRAPGAGRAFNEV